MRTIEIKVYTYEELDEHGKEFARDWFKNNIMEYGYNCDEDCQKSTNAIAEAIGLEWVDQGYAGDVNVTFKGTALHLRGKRALSYVWNNWIKPNLKGKYYGKTVWANGSALTKSRRSKCQFSWDCPLTGYCMDMVMVEAFDKFCGAYRKDLQVETDRFIKILETLISKEWADQRQGELSDEYVEDNIVANAYEFTSDGELYRD